MTGLDLLAAALVLAGALVHPDAPADDLWTLAVLAVALRVVLVLALGTGGRR